MAPRGTLGRGVCIGDGRATAEALNRTLGRLGVAYLDVYLLHWPLTTAAYALDDPAHAARRLDAWRALVDAKRIADYIQGQKKEEEARRARERES